MNNPARSVSHLRFESANVLKKRQVFVRPRIMVAAFVAVLILVGWLIKVAVVPAVIHEINLPVVHQSNRTKDIVQIEIGARVYTPESDPEWETRVKTVMKGRYHHHYTQ